MAISTKDTKALKLLLKNGADANLFNRFGDTPLFQALMSENIEAFEILLSYGANVELDNSSGHSVLEYIGHTEDNSEREQYQKILNEYFREK